jgi:RHS repeat-associated protein
VGYYRSASSSRSYVRARHLDLSRGRWLTEDPVRYLDVGLYTYAALRPTTDVDPSGLLHCLFSPSGGTGRIACYSNAGECFLSGSNRMGPPWCPPAGTSMLNCTAYNGTTNPTASPTKNGHHGPAPTGTYPFGPPGPPPNNDPSPNGSYGPYFIPVGTPTRSGIGVHGGRQNLGGPIYVTYGCIRVSNSCIALLRNLLNNTIAPPVPLPNPGITITIT